MTDTEILEWIAEHMVSFRPMFGMATMVYLNDEGVECEIVVQEFEKITTKPIEQLRECVVAAALRK